MKIRIFAAATLSLAAAACGPAATTAETGTPAPAATTAAAPATAGAMNPVGRYEFATSVQGQTVTGNVMIAGTAGAYTGQITTSITPPLPISSVTVAGQQLTIVANTPDGPLAIRMNFADATAFTGGWELSGDSGSLTGRKLM